jgi:hypothetical protein
MNLLSIFSNAWFVGIGGGILSGLVVTFVTRALLSGRDQREYAQKLFGANREIIYAVRPGIPEGLIPTTEVLDSIIQATARKFGVDTKDLYHPHEIAQELMKEVMDSSFISAKVKEEYCTRLNVLAKPAPGTMPEIPPSQSSGSDNRRIPAVEEYRSRMIAMMSIMLGVMSAAMTVVLSLPDTRHLFGESGMSANNLIAVIGPMLFVTMALGFSMFGMFAIRNLRDSQKKRDQDSEGPGGRSSDKPTNER